MARGCIVQRRPRSLALQHKVLPTVVSVLLVFFDGVATPSAIFASQGSFLSTGFITCSVLGSATSVTRLKQYTARRSADGQPRRGCERLKFGWE